MLYYKVAAASVIMLIRFPGEVSAVPTMGEERVEEVARGITGRAEQQSMLYYVVAASWRSIRSSHYEQY